MKNIIFGAVALVFAMGQAHAALLLKLDAIGEGAASDAGSNDGGFFITLSIPSTSFSYSEAFDPSFVLFAGTLITEDTTLRASSGAAFDLFAESLTDGDSQLIYLTIGRNIGGTPSAVSVVGQYESSFFRSANPLVTVNASTNGIDLASFVITEVVMTISNVEASASTTGYFIKFDRTLEIYGTPAAVPVPAALPLMGAGLGLFAALRRRRRAR
ncbi:PEP-CTERM sorting domain-containing protein [Parvularcula sp. LCG005]|uniref:PEP-CTERM sorting domain-containing protein n=1 Tax=Parvularcula sp. LCG005 TaxID=3078805 RepID=UPI002943D980|nr:PEP-CTERM sorting domain-containing protein [Parvularcula sp. LCG005]WOI52185.1 PEP-CTERM sorting domain-containing protein [Parvularcula sp. LCG005]